MENGAILNPTETWYAKPCLSGRNASGCSPKIGVNIGRIEPPPWCDGLWFGCWGYYEDMWKNTQGNSSYQE